MPPGRDRFKVEWRETVAASGGFEVGAEQELKEPGKELDKHYIPARYPNSYPQGSPHEYYTRAEAERAAAHAALILRFCESHLV